MNCSLYRCAQLWCTTAQSWSNNLPSYPPDNHHSSDVVCWRGGGLGLCTQPAAMLQSVWRPRLVFLTMLLVLLSDKLFSCPSVLKLFQTVHDCPIEENLWGWFRWILRPSNRVRTQITDANQEKSHSFLIQLDGKDIMPFMLAFQIPTPA